MREGRGREDPDGPVFVPQTFEDEYLDEARRKVARSHRRRTRSWQPAWNSQGPRERLRVVLEVGHGIATILILTLAVITRTWLIGATVLLLVAVSLVVCLYVLRRFSWDQVMGQRR